MPAPTSESGDDAGQSEDNGGRILKKTEGADDAPECRFGVVSGRLLGHSGAYLGGRVGDRIAPLALWQQQGPMKDHRIPVFVSLNAPVVPTNVVQPICRRHWRLEGVAELTSVLWSPSRRRVRASIRVARRTPPAARGQLHAGFDERERCPKHRPDDVEHDSGPWLGPGQTSTTSGWMEYLGGTGGDGREITCPAPTNAE